MLTIKVAQHFFSSVPAAQSPVGRRGYQTIASTPDLPPEVVRAIEDRAQYATAPDDELKLAVLRFTRRPGSRWPHRAH